ncbi:S-adenosyl-L-methionine-dependent methyltransferase [Sporormia fimetaria CBS 119925]|uniref:S-adenosyl-L-methionine-dependent methyltransferase n=1 Tax=Sporormia fimetaria CBS 119925 TaxID=1340428 RepID=A0A6A6VGL1_9PLEO|nr:S-adenosyl-L-methionine-dependent methyltransferase [Sporormia fimetaria CBS 119925]
MGLPRLPPEAAHLGHNTPRARLIARQNILDTWSTYREPWLTWVNARLPYGHVLDFGAGHGEIWRSSPRLDDTLFSSLTLADYLLKTEVQHALRAQGVGVNVVQLVDEKGQRMRELPFQKDRFDVVVANLMGDLFGEWEDVGKLLEEFKRVLKSGGSIVVALSGRDHLEELFVLEEKVRGPGAWGSRPGLTAENAVGLLEQHFEDLVVERYPADYEIRDVESVIEYWGNWGDKGLTEEQLDVAKREVEQKLSGGVWRVKGNLVLVRGRKKDTRV